MAELIGIAAGLAAVAVAAVVCVLIADRTFAAAPADKAMPETAPAHWPPGVRPLTSVWVAGPRTDELIHRISGQGDRTICGDIVMHRDPDRDDWCVHGLVLRAGQASPRYTRWCPLCWLVDPSQDLPLPRRRRIR